ncbi:Protein of unknown function [Propionibacterium freudenreichii subsp. freudenreichii]|jgi:hypothetical protein
MVVT